MVRVVLVYPYFRSSRNSEFRFPPLGLGYISSTLRTNGIDVEIVDCTFLSGVDEAVRKVKEKEPSIIGIYSMFTLNNTAMRLGKALHDHCELLVAGGPLPSVDPEPLLDVFDVVVRGEGEQTMLDIVKQEKETSEINGIVYKEKDSKFTRSTLNDYSVVETAPRGLIQDLDSVPFPARDLFDNENYIDYYHRKGDPASTSIMSSRGCVFNCDFCSRPVFGGTFRERSSDNILEEIEQVLELGYKKVVFQDDCFTLTKERVLDFCDNVLQRGLKFSWACLSRVDTLDDETALLMKKAGCDSVFFGLESGSDEILKIMNKQTDKERAVEAVKSATTAGIKAGAFFIIGYPGETDETLIETINFTSSFGLDYLSFNFPYPIPGTGLYEKVKDDLLVEDPLSKGKTLTFRSKMSKRKLEFAEYKGLTQHKIRKYPYPIQQFLYHPFRVLTDYVLKLMD